jgi:beta-lactamase superfamily II metal-dependent hydrolase
MGSWQYVHHTQAQLPFGCLKDAGIADFYPDNEKSIIFRFSWREQWFVFIGDLENHGLHQWLQQNPRSCSILQMPHHGSWDKRLSMLLSHLNPDLVFASGTQRSVQKSTRNLCQKLKIPLLETSHWGAIRFLWRDNQFVWKPFHYKNTANNDHKIVFK